jgi:RNA polymerase sigma-70 factor, ECF subfamily
VLKLLRMENLKNLTDEQVVNYVRTKDQESYVEIVLRYQNKLMRYADLLISDNMKATDIVQSSFIKAFVNLNSFNTKKKFSTWIYRIVHNEAINEIVKYKKEIPMLEEMDFANNEDIMINFIAKEERERVKKCLYRMPVLYSEPLSLFFLEERSYNEISDILRLPIGTVGTRINRAKILMKKICQTIQN